MNALFKLDTLSKRSSYKKLVLSSICALPLAALLSTPAYAQLVNTATVTGLPDAGTLTNAQATESVEIFEQIEAVAETFPVINGTDGGVTTSVLASDLLNGLAVDSDDVTITVGASDPELTLDPATGFITVAPNTPAGTYTVEYTVCEDANPINCATVTETVTVEEAPITAAAETFPAINGTDGGVTTSVLASDMLNGEVVNPDDITLTVGTSDPELTLDPDTGLITVAAGTPAGTYTVEYTICEDLNPANCATVIETVTVEEAPITAAPETFPAINGTDGGVTTSVLASDMLNGEVVDPADITLTVGASDPELTLDPDTGLITVAAGTPAGTYTVEYTICEDLNPANCATVTETVTVEEAPITAAPETFPVVNGVDGGVTTSVLASDMLNGEVVDPADITLTVGTSDPELTLDPDTGLITVAAGTPAGTYTVEYTICEDLNPANCATVTETVTVEEAPITAAAETFPAINGTDGGVTTSVLASDMLNGEVVDPADITLTVGASDPELTLDPDTGLITVAAGTPAGTYTVEYTICEDLNPANCATVTETVTVEEAPITAAPETFPVVNGVEGGVTTSVLASDMLNGEVVNPDDITLTVGTSDPELTLDPDTGLITVAAGTPAGTYTVEYTICEDLNPANCATVTETVTVEEAPITAAPETFPVVNGVDGGVTTSVLASDMLNGEVVDPADITLTVGASDPELTLDPDTGLITVAAGTPAGTYTVEYTICEDLNPANCATVTETVTVEEAPITAAPETFPVVNGVEGGVTTSVLASDMLNGEVVDPADITLTVGTSDPELTLDPDTGLITVAAGTPAGTYTVEYTICEDLNPANCATVTETVTVEEAPITAAAETFPAINGTDGGVTTSVLASDMLNGEVVDPADITLTVGASDPELTLDPDTGLITVAAGTPAGTYTVEYTICEDLNPANCATVTETVTVEEAPITAAPETFPVVNGVEGGVTTSVLASDMLNGEVVDPADITLTVGASDPELTLDPDTGLITVAAGTPAGTYTVEYTICEDLNPANCATVTETVTVEEAPITAAPETFPVVNGVDGGVTTSVLASDMLNGEVVDPADITLTVGASDPELTLDPDTGLITVAAGTPAGTYTVEYTICEDLNPANCATVTETVTVEEAPITAAAETFPAINGTDGGVTTSVLASDMLNGEVVDPADITLTVGASDPELTLDPDTGLITVAAGTPAGTYTVEYTICEDLNPANCATVTETVTVEEAPITAAPETFPVVNGVEGGVTTSVLASDMLNGEVVNPDDITLTVGTSDPELTLDPDTGLITVAAGTPAGTYTVEYTICEDLNPANCATVTETVTVEEAPITAAAETFPAINGTDGGVTTSVLASDMLNGEVVDPADITLTVGASDPELTLDPDTGLITVAAGTPAGTYTVEYTICEDLNPANCATVTETVTVEEAPITAAAETFPAINGTDGGVTTSVLASDMLNGEVVDPADITLTVGASDPELTLDPDTGLITVAAGTPAGTYTVEYTICEDLNPANCATVTETVTVEEAPITAAPETFPVVNGVEGGVTTSVLASDMLNGEVVNPDDITLTVGTSDPELTLDPDTGLITVAAGTPAGTYTVEYTICEDLNPANCATVTETVTVEEAPITAAAETFPAINGTDGGVTTSVLASDMLNGEVVDPADITLTVGASDPELTLDPDTGLITVAAGTPAGTYTVEYTICEDLNPANCATVTETVTVEEAPITAAPETFPVVNGVEGGVTTSVLASDMLNGEVVDPADITLTVGASDPELTLDPDTGLITVAAGTPAGTYTVEYTICEDLNPANCATVTETVTVEEAPITAAPETFPVVNGVDGGVTTSVLASDMLNGEVVDPADITLTVGASDPELTLDPDTGLITVAAGTPAGTYTVEYTICEDLNPANCATVTETVTVEEAPITAAPETFPVVNGVEGGVTTSVLASDMLNGEVVDPADITLTVGTSDPELTLDPDTGLITVAAGTPAGTYTVEYTICEDLNPANCATVIETVTVEEAPITAAPETFPAINGTDGGVTTSVLASDMLNGEVVDPADITLTVGASDPELTLDPDTGLITVAAGTPAGTYTVEYTICEDLNPANCATVTETVTVEEAPITAAPETFPVVNGVDGGVTTSVLASDMLNGEVVDPADITLTVGTSDPELTLDPDTGLITVAAGTPAGTYTVEYTICEDLNPANCATVTETVTVEEAPITAAAETFPAINGTDGGVTTSVLASDMLNGEVVDPADITLTVGASDPELTLDPDTGLITVAAGTPAGTYTVEYTICEDLNPANCATVTETVTVEEAPITAAPETFPVVNGVEGGVTTSVLASDMLNGEVVNPDDITLTVGTSDPELTLDPDTGLITVAAGTPAGTYTVEYTICEDLNPANCATVTETVTVEEAPITAAAETFPAINGTDGGVTTSVLASDMLNGEVVDPADITLTVGASDPELTLDPDTGLITVAAGTPAGTYTVEYTICEDLNPANCATVTETVTVEEAPITAAPETFPVVNGVEGGVTTSVLASDMLNGEVVDPADITLTVGTSDPELTLDPDTGLITVAAGTPAGTYTVEYTICEDLNPANCATVTETVTVEEAPITAAAETFPAINGTDGGVTTSVLASDMLNGEVVDPADITLTVGASDPELTLDPDTGLITVAAGTPAGTYTVEYTICEDLNPANCATVTETVTVEEAPITAAPETFPVVNGVEGGVTTSVLASDMLNGEVVDPADITLTVGASDPELTLDPDTGLITVAAGTPAGTYTVEYTICEDLNPANCATVTETVTVEEAPITAAPETFPVVNGVDGGVTTSVLASDMLNGEVVDPADITLTVGASDPELTLDPDTGLITVAAGTPAGTYTVEYTICEDLNPANCATVTETVTVEEAPITAAPETFPVVNGVEGGVTTSVLASDMLNGEVVDPADITLTVGTSDPELTLDPDTGLITVAAGTPAGTYTVEYTICEDLNPANCATVVETVEVGLAPIVATPDVVSGIESAEGGTAVINALDGDTLNGVAVTADTVTVAPIAGFEVPEGLKLNADGTVDVAPGTPAGTYVIEYEICEILNPSNCAVSTVTVTIDAPAILPTALLSGVVYFDTNSNNTPDFDETVFAGWTVEVRNTQGDVVAELVTDSEGFYSTELPFGNFTVDFINPVNDAVYSSSDIVLDASASPSNSTEPLAVVVNLPIDPSGVVYDAITRQPVAGTQLTFVDRNNQPLPPICFIAPSQQDQITGATGSYRFDIVPGADVSCPVGQTDYRIIYDAPASHLDANSTIIAAQPGFLTTNSGTGPILVAPSEDAPQVGEDTTHYFGFTLGAGSRDVINNHIPLDPITLARSPIDVVKSTPRQDVNFGDIVPYTITVTNTEDLPRLDLDIIDFTPPGFRYVEDTSRLDGIAIEPSIAGRELSLEDLNLAANESKSWTLMLVVGASVKDGIYTNQAYIRDTAGDVISNQAEAVVQVTPDPLFDCSELIGKVFDDKNNNGYQDQGEPGLPGVRLATAKGLLVTTDQYGRYHIACAAIPNENIGSNFILKVDKSTLPTGYHLTTENPRVVRLTRGKLSKANFGAAIENIVNLDVTDAAYLAGTNTLRPEFAGQMGQIIDALKGQESTLRLTYFASTAGREERIDALSSQIRELWDMYGGDYDLNIDRKTIWTGGNTTSQTGWEE